MIKKLLSCQHSYLLNRQGSKFYLYAKSQKMELYFVSKYLILSLNHRGFLFKLRQHFVLLLKR